MHYRKKKSILLVQKFQTSWSQHLQGFNCEPFIYDDVPISNYKEAPELKSCNSSRFLPGWPSMIHCSTFNKIVTIMGFYKQQRNKLKFVSTHFFILSIYFIILRMEKLLYFSRTFVFCMAVIHIQRQTWPPPVATISASINFELFTDLYGCVVTTKVFLLRKYAEIATAAQKVLIFMQVVPSVVDSGTKVICFIQRQWICSNI